MKSVSGKTGHTTGTRVSKKRKSDSSTHAHLEYDQEKPHKSSAIRKRVKGKLSGLMNLPIDILFETFGNLKPLDLLKLARTTKDFRRLLMKKSSKSVWKAALESIPDLPPCPPEMSEPAWVHLVFDPHCHFCNKAFVRGVEWTLKVRICSKCAKDKCIDIYLPSEPSMNNLSEFPVGTLLFSRPGKSESTSHLHRVLRDDLTEMKKKYSTLPDDETRMKFIRERREYLAEVEQHADLCSEWAAGQSQDRYFELKQLKTDRLNAITEKLIALGYEEDIAIIRDRYPFSLAYHELVKKPQKLTERIWANIRGPILEFMADLRSVRLSREHSQLVMQRKPSAIAVFRAYMAERYPFTDVMPSGLEFCGFEPVKKILEQPAEVIVDETSFASVVPLIPDFIADWREPLDRRLMEVIQKERHFWYLRWNEFGELIGSELDDQDTGDNDGDTSMECTTTKTRRWYLQPPQEDETSLRNDLKLATTVFQCRNCILRNVRMIDPLGFDFDYDDMILADKFYEDDLDDELPLLPLHQLPLPGALFYPKVLGHICLTRYPWRSYDDVDDVYRPLKPVEPARKLDDSNQWRRQWSTHPLRINKGLGNCVKVLVEKAGLNPETTTAEDMDQVAHWFACIHCAFGIGEEANPRGPYEVPTFPWRLAIEHHGSQHYHKKPLWAVIRQEEIGEALEAFESHPGSSHNDLHIARRIRMTCPRIPPTQDTTWSCVYCRDTSAEIPPSSLEAITLHLDREHQIQQPEENKDYYRDFAAPCALEHQLRLAVFFTKEDVKVWLQAYIADVGWIPDKMLDLYRAFIDE